MPGPVPPSLAASLPELTPVAPPPVDTARVDEALKLHLKSLVQMAKDQTTELRQRCRRQEEIYETPPKGMKPQQRAEDLNNWIKVNESSDQVDDQTNILMNLFTEEGRPVKIEPKGQEMKERADLVEEAVLYELRTTEFEDVLEKSTKCYVTMPFSGLKSVRDFKDGLPRFYIQQVDPNCFAVGDIGRKVQNQFSVHELHFYTKREMRLAGFKNLDKLGKPDATGQQAISDVSIQGQDVPANTPEGSGQYRIWESWTAPIFGEWIDDGKLATPEVTQWAANWKVPGAYLWQWDEKLGANAAEGNLLRFFHDENGTVLKVTINYLTRPSRFPHHCGSWYQPLTNRFANMSQTERSSDLFSAQEVLINDCYRNAKLIGNQAMFVSQRSQVSPDQLEKIYKPRGQVFFAGNDDPTMLFKEFRPESVSKDLMPLIDLFQDKIEQGGVTDTMRGEGHSRTATESKNNNLRGQMQTNASGSRYVRECLLPACEDVMQMIVAFYGDKWYQVCGDKGGQMAEWMFTTPEEIDQHFKVSPVTSFDYLMQNNMVTELANLMQVGGQFIPPDMAARVFKVAIDFTRIPTAQREFIAGTMGQISKIMDELETLKNDPNAIITVLPEDNHQAALLGVELVTNGNPQTGDPPMPMFPQFPGVRRYVEQHMIFLEIQKQEMMQQQLMEQAVKGAKGATKQVTGGQLPTGEESKVRAEGQAASPADATATPGNTGMGAMQ